MCSSVVGPGVLPAAALAYPVGRALASGTWVPRAALMSAATRLPVTAPANW
ncbi:hypothetical protein HEP87_62055 [Streptomyces sp. S1D4-11]